MIHEITLSLEQLRAVQLGARLALELSSFDATVFQNIVVDENNQKYVKGGSWLDYLEAIGENSARLLLDDGTGEVREYRVFAPPSSGGGSPPAVTLRDAMVWAFGARPAASGSLELILEDHRTGEGIRVLPDGWRFGFDATTMTRIRNDAALRGNLLLLPLRAKQVILAKANPGSAPAIVWAGFDPEARQIRAYVTDFLGVDRVLFYPRLDLEPQEMPRSDDAGTAGLYVLDLGRGYRYTHNETIVAVNLDGETTTLRPPYVGADRVRQSGGGGTWSIGKPQPVPLTWDRPVLKLKVEVPSGMAPDRLVPRDGARLAPLPYSFLLLPNPGSRGGAARYGLRRMPYAAQTLSLPVQTAPPGVDMMRSYYAVHVGGRNYAEIVVETFYRDGKVSGRRFGIFGVEYYP